MSTYLYNVFNKHYTLTNIESIYNNSINIIGRKGEKSATYYIQQVIRKWEERHNLIKTARLTNAYRVHSDTDVKLLLAVKSYSEQGRSLKICYKTCKSKQ